MEVTARSFLPLASLTPSPSRGSAGALRLPVHRSVSQSATSPSAAPRPLVLSFAGYLPFLPSRPALLPGSGAPAAASSVTEARGSKGPGPAAPARRVRLRDRGTRPPPRAWAGDLRAVLAGDLCEAVAGKGPGLAVVDGKLVKH